MSERRGEARNNEALEIAGKIVSAFASRNSMQSGDIAKLLEEVYGVVSSLGSDEKLQNLREPAAPIAKSVTPDYIICLEDGKKLKMLKRYLRTHYDLSPDEYRRKWGLPADYPMTAPNYAKQRSALAKEIGLGTAATTTRRRKSKAARKSASRRRAAG